MTANATSNKSNKNKVLVIIGLILVMLIPIPITVNPEWKVIIKDSSSQPLKNVEVLNTWKHSTFQFNGGREYLKSDEQGAVLVPERKTSIPIIGMIFNPIINTLSTGAHTSYGSHSIIIVTTENCELGVTYYVEGDKNPKTLKLNKNESCNN
ncbi:hypothetical protein [Kangiella sp. TOML190]|uniref:hypothetical protein n=1 Tax=Kangiella sp. TOML190 TaxID=2931351 RepID=UPI0020417EB4|nr:hypothetical protein [Kangiella sp. TOML190]